MRVASNTHGGSGSENTFLCRSLVQSVCESISPSCDPDFWKKSSSVFLIDVYAPQDETNNQMPVWMYSAIPLRVETDLMALFCKKSKRAVCVLGVESCNDSTHNASHWCVSRASKLAHRKGWCKHGIQLFLCFQRNCNETLLKTIRK